MGQKSAETGHGDKPVLSHLAPGKLFLSVQQYMGTCFECGKLTAAKGEGWILPFICRAQDTVGL